FLTKDKTAGQNGSVDRTDQVLFIDARNLGHMIDRAERALSDEDIAKITGNFHAWRGTDSAGDKAYADEAGFCYSGSIEALKEARYAVLPARYVVIAEDADDGEPIEEKISRLKTEHVDQLEEAERLTANPPEPLRRIS